MPTATPAFTSLPPPLWSGALGEPVVLNDITGVWSPVANEMVGIQSTAYYTGTLALVSAPDFTVQPYTFEGANNAIEQVTWSPNGEAFLFCIPTSYIYLFYIDTVSDAWMVNRDGSGAVKLAEGFRGLSFPYWLDRRTVVATGYSGGGHERVAEIDYLSGKIIVNDTVHVYSMEAPEGKYLPVESSVGPLFVQIITQVKQGNNPEYCLDMDCYTRVFSYDETDPVYKWHDAHFEDWQPGTHNALVQVTSWTKTYQAFRIFYWNVDTDRVTTIIPGGLHARYSPDGQSLLFTTIGPSSFYTASISGPLTLDPVPEKGDVYLQLMSYYNRQVSLSLPVMTWKNYENTMIGEFVTAKFSPSGRYLAFVTIGPVITDARDWPASVDTSDPSAVHLNILDLKTKRLLQSLPNISPYLKVNWSPTSQYLVYMDTGQNWYLVDLARNDIFPILHSGGEQPHWTDYLHDHLRSPAWSFDGRYLSFVVRGPHEGNFDHRNVTTYVFDVTVALGGQP